MRTEFSRLHQGLLVDVNSPRHIARFQEASTKHEHLRRCDTIHDVLAVLAEGSGIDYAEKDALVRELIIERQQTNSCSFWNAALLVAYFPMLSNLRGRIRGNAFPDDDLDQIVLMSFLEEVEKFPAEKRQSFTSIELRHRTERRVFRAVKHEQKQRRGQISVEPASDEIEGGAPWPAIADTGPRGPRNPADASEAVTSLVKHAGALVGGEMFEVLTATLVCHRKLTRFLDQVIPALSGEERRLAYQRIRKCRTRVLARIRHNITRHWGLDFQKADVAGLATSRSRKARTSPRREQENAIGPRGSTTRSPVIRFRARHGHLGQRERISASPTSRQKSLLKQALRWR
ncbi:MAG: hypothetical protein MUC50_05285 [Myxococcota bacterium]|jgi:hypothetical protein|nr:hypothetical protein [Myxococcota bacterium]